MNGDSEERKRLLQLIRRIAREVAYEVMDEHLTDCKHEEKSAEDVLENEDLGSNCRSFEDKVNRQRRRAEPILKREE
jgi:hypothetical protein